MKRYLFAALFFLAGGAALYMGLVSDEIGNQRGWPTTPGKLLARRAAEASGTEHGYLPDVKYQYEVGGKKYINDQVYPTAHPGGPRDEIQKLVDGLPDPVPVHYNPDRPGDAFLLVTPGGPKWLLVIAGGVGIVMGLAQLLVAATRKPRA